MKKYIAIVIAALMILGSLSGCGSTSKGGDNTATGSDSDQIQIVTTIFPEYDWVMNILGDNSANANVTMLLDNGVDLHSYQPSAEDILKISTCDLFIYVGGESDGWVDDAVKESVNKDMIVINLLDVLGDSVKEEEMVEGMQESEHEHEYEGEEAPDGDTNHEDEQHEDEEHEDADHEEEHEIEYDEHVWLSLRNTKVLTEKISEALANVDPDHADSYTANEEAYKEKLDTLDKEYQSVVDGAPVKTLLFGDRFPFRYMTDDYGLDYYAAFVGCSAETEASFETIHFLAEKVDELNLHNVMTIEGSDQKIAETIIKSTKSQDQKILTLNSMQSTTSEDVKNGTTYLTVMENNLTVLKEALQ